MSTEFSLADILAAAGSDESREPKLTTAQQIVRLQEAFALRQETHVFRPGDIMLHKYPEHAPFRSAKEPVLFLEYLEKPVHCADYMTSPPQAYDSSAADVLDCRVLLFGNDSINMHFANSLDYRPHPEG